jgi:hypothetical protein
MLYPCGGRPSLAGITAWPYVLTLSAQKDEVTQTEFCKHVSKPCNRRLSDYSSVEAIQTLSVSQNVPMSDNVISIHVSSLHECSWSLLSQLPTALYIYAVWRIRIREYVDTVYLCVFSVIEFLCLPYLPLRYIVRLGFTLPREKYNIRTIT